MKQIILFLCMNYLAGAPSSAAEAGASLRFLAERAPSELGEVLLSSGDKTSEPFTLSSEHLTAPIVAPARKFSLNLRSKPISLAEIVLPQTGNAFVVLLIPNPKGGYLSLVMPSDDPSFKAGDVYIYNNAGKTVLGYVGTSKFVLKPREGKPVRPEGAHEDTYFDVGFGVREETGDRVLHTVRWPVVRRSRSYVFFYQNPVKDRIEYRAVDEFVAPAGDVVSP